jgi:hypothetical protein
MPSTSAGSLSNGLVDITTLTALIGSSTAASLMLGSRGAAGLPYAALSAFGTVSIIQVCISAATPAWLKGTLGVQNRDCDTIIGVTLDQERALKGAKIEGYIHAEGLRVLSRPKVSIVFECCGRREIQLSLSRKSRNGVSVNSEKARSMLCRRSRYTCLICVLHELSKLTPR